MNKVHRMLSFKLPALSLLYAILICLIPSPAAAGAGGGQITGYIGQFNGIAFFNLAGRSDVPSCATSYPNRWIVDATTPAGAALLSSVLTAYALGKTVNVQGSGDCRLGYSTEAVSYIYLP